MAKLLPDGILDGMLDVQRVGAGGALLVCAGQPTDRASALLNELARATLTDPTDYTRADGDVSGRKDTIAAKSAMPITVTGLADHMAVIDDSELKLVTVISNPQTLTSGGTVDSSAFDSEVSDAQ